MSVILIHAISIRKKTLIVYKNGYAEGSFLAAKLTILFKDALDIVGTYPSNELNPCIYTGVELIISTTALKQVPEIPIVVIDIPLLRKDVENISKAITRETEHPIRKIIDVFSPSLFIRSSAKSEKKSYIPYAICFVRMGELRTALNKVFSKESVEFQLQWMA